MYHLSTQYHQWLFTDDQLKEIRAKTNADFVPKRVKTIVYLFFSFKSFRKCFLAKNPEERLTVEDEAMVLRYYEVQLKEFCNKFEPPMTTTAIVSRLNDFIGIFIDFSTDDCCSIFQTILFV